VYVVTALFKIVGLVEHIEHKEAVKLAEKSIPRLEDKGLSVSLEPSLAEACTTDGDYTNLRTCFRMPKLEPLISIIKSDYEPSFVRLDADFYHHLKVKFLFLRGERI